MYQQHKKRKFFIQFYPALHGQGAFNFSDSCGTNLGNVLNIQFSPSAFLISPANFEYRSLSPPGFRYLLSVARASAKFFS